MKIVFSNLVILFLSFNLVGQNLIFKDAAFKNYLVTKNCVDTDLNGSFDSKADTNGDLEISEEEANIILSLSISFGSLVTDISDLQHFKKLRIFNGSNLDPINTPFDLSKNSDLEILYLSINHSKINISNFTKLTDCSLKLGKDVTKINLNNNSALKTLIFTSSGNQTKLLDSVDVSNNELENLSINFPWDKYQYKYLNASNNKISKITVQKSHYFDELILTNNKLTESSVTGGVLTGRKYYIGKNSIVNLKYDDFQSTYQKVFEFENNPLKSFEFKSYSVENNVEKLDFTGFNELENIKIEFLGKIETIMINNLPNLNVLSIDGQIKNDLVIDECLELNKISINTTANIFLTNTEFYNGPDFNVVTSGDIIVSDSKIESLIISNRMKYGELFIQNSSQLKSINLSRSSGWNDTIKILNNPLLRTVNFGSNDFLDLRIEKCMLLDSVIVKLTETLVFNYDGINELSFLSLRTFNGDLNIQNLEFLKKAVLPIGEYINLRLNQLKNLDSLTLIGESVGSLALNGLPNLTYLYFNNLQSGACNNMDVVGDLELKNMPLLNFLYLNKICVDNLVLNNLPSLSSLSFDNLNFSKRGNSISLYNLENLRELHLSSTFFNTFYLSKLSQLEKFTCTQSYFKNQFRLTNLEKLKEVDFNHMGADEIIFKTLPNLKKLNLYAISTKNSSFIDLPVLENISCHLSISGSDLKNKVTFRKLPVLKKLFYDCTTQILDTLDLSECPAIDSISIDSWSSISYINLKNKNEKIKYFEPGGHLNEYKTFCLDNEAEKANLLPFLHPQTSASFIYDCENSNDFSNINGQLYILDDQNNPQLLKNQFVPIHIEGINLNTVFTDNFGRFQFSTDVIGQSVRLAPEVNTEFFELVKPDTTFLLSEHSDIDSVNFYIKTKKTLYDISVTLLPIGNARPGSVSTYIMTLKNNSSETVTSNLLLEFDKNLMKPELLSQQFVFIDENKIKLDNLQLFPNEKRDFIFKFDINRPTDINFPVNAGDILVLKASTVPNQPIVDYIPENNISELKQIVVNSFDPNHIICLQGEKVSDNSKIKPLKYVIEFENTGNAEALEVFVLNEIDTQFLDLKTFKIIQTSHTVDAMLVNDTIFFNFYNINLSHILDMNKGYIHYEIQPKKDLKIGDKIRNQAYIYFDYNFPIITNKHILELVALSNIELVDYDEEIIIYPNPNSGTLFLNTIQSVDKVEIFNIFGECVKILPLMNNTVEFEELKSGHYFIKIYNHKKLVCIRKMVVIKE